MNFIKQPYSSKCHGICLTLSYAVFSILFHCLLLVVVCGIWYLIFWHHLQKNPVLLLKLLYRWCICMVIKQCCSQAEPRQDVQGVGWSDQWHLWLCVSVCPHCKRKMAWAINTKFDTHSLAVAWYALTRRLKGHRSRSHGYENGYCHTVATNEVRWCSRHGKQGGHSPGKLGKPGKVREFQNGHGNVREMKKVWESQGKLKSVMFIQCNFCVDIYFSLILKQSGNTLM